MFSTKSQHVFAAVRCPADGDCLLPNCLFKHGLRDASPQSKHTSASKRRKLNDSSSKESSSVAPSHGANLQRPASKQPALAQQTKNFSPNTPEFRPRSNDQVIVIDDTPSPSTPAVKHGATKPANAVSATPTKTTTQSQKPLKPLPVTYNPTGHGQRNSYLTKLHELMKVLNDQAMSSKDPQIRREALTAPKLVDLALEQEARIATDSPTVYPNIIKQQLLMYKRMSVENWVKLVIEAANQAMKTEKAKPRQEGRFDAELTDALKKAVLARLVCKQDGLDQFGFVTSVPTDEQVVLARRADVAMAGFEECRRCQSHFQVFPDRREDGALTSGGACRYHWGRATLHKGGESYYRCCEGRLGLSEGCTEAETHVFETKSPERQASILQFASTPDNHAAADRGPLAIDCEMGFTTYGNELIRVSVLYWPSGEVLLDVLVRPFGTLLDFNTRFSGVTAEHFAQAKAYDKSSTSTEAQLVESPAEARQLLFDHIKPTTTLIGHAIENDLRALRIVHPTIVDTALLCPHPRAKLPVRRALRELAKQYLNRTIQVAGALGHDSHEDAKATGDVVVELVKSEWNRLRRGGWTANGDVLVPPGRKQAKSDEKEQAVEGK